MRDQVWAVRSTVPHAYRPVPLPSTSASACTSDEPRHLPPPPRTRASSKDLQAGARYFDIGVLSGHPVIGDTEGGRVCATEGGFKNK